METLVEDLGFAPAVKTELLGELQLWRKHGEMSLNISETKFLSLPCKSRRSYQNRFSGPIDYAGCRKDMIATST